VDREIPSVLRLVTKEERLFQYDGGRAAQGLVRFRGAECNERHNKRGKNSTVNGGNGNKKYLMGGDLCGRAGRKKKCTARGYASGYIGCVGSSKGN